jgi:hypothetical protein
MLRERYKHDFLSCSILHRSVCIFDPLQVALTHLPPGVSKERPSSIEGQGMTFRNHEKPDDQAMGGALVFSRTHETYSYGENS